MKIIDLYELIANKEYDKLPRKIKFRGCIYDLEIDEEFINYNPENGEWLLNQFLWKLNEEIEILEILEEEKEIPLKVNKIIPSQNYVISDSKNNSIDERLEIIRKRLYADELYMLDIANTLNEIIDYLKSKGDE